MGNDIVASSACDARTVEYAFLCSLAANHVSGVLTLNDANRGPFAEVPAYFATFGVNPAGGDDVGIPRRTDAQARCGRGPRWAHRMGTGGWWGS